MDQDLKPIKRWYKKKRWWLVFIFIAAAVSVFIFLRSGQKIDYEKITVQRGDLIQEVSVTGKIKPAQAVDLQFENTGRVASLNYKVGEKVNSGTTIASLDNQDLYAEVASAKADLDKTIRNFDSLNDKTIYSSLRVELENATANLDQVSNKAASDLASDYSSAFNAIREAVTQIDTSLVILEYLRKTNLEAKDPWDSVVKQSELSVNAKVSDIYTTFPSIKQQGVVITPSLYGQIDEVLQDVSNTCQQLRNVFTYLQVEMQSNPYLISSATDRASVNTEATAISSDLSAISTAIQNIADQRAINAKNISDANSTYASAKAAFPTAEDITQKQAALLSAQSKLRKSLIIAPFTGTIGKVNVERGQTVSSATVIVSLISDADYQIEANITEIDIGKIKVGDPAVLTLDAYGSRVFFTAIVATVDTSATVIDGVTTYKTIFNFDGPIDPGIRPNMTANLDVQTARRDNIISIPQRAVITRNGDKLIRIYLGEGIIPEERAVQLGMSGRDGYVEIVSGLSEGEQVITFIND